MEWARSYRAEDTDLGRAVALKVLPETLVADPDRLARFVQEARTASSLNHPHLAAIYEIGKGVPAGTGFTGTDAVHFIAMELVDGETLRHLIERQPRDLRRTLEYLRAGGRRALGGARRRHRTSRFQTRKRDGRWRGLRQGPRLRSREAACGQSLLSSGTDATTMAKGTAPWTVMGTIGYMSPEQAQGRPLDPRSDIFAFGCVLYETATGTRAFSGTSAVETLHQIINARSAAGHVEAAGRAH